MEADLFKLAGQLGSLVVGNVDQHKILRNRCTKRAAAKALGKLSRGFQLFAGHTPAQHGCANVAQALLALRMNAGVVAQNVAGNGLRYSRQKSEIESRLEFGEKALGGPS